MSRPLPPGHRHASGPSPSDDRASGAGRALRWSVVLLNVVFATALLVITALIALQPADERPWSTGVVVAAAAAGLVWLVVGISVHRNYLHVPPPDERRVTLTTVDGEPAVVMAWRRTFQRQPLLVGCVVVAGGLALTAALAADGNPGWWIALILVVPVAPFLPDRVIEATRPVRLVLTPRGIGASGADGDAWLDWDDVRGIARERDNQWWVIRVVGVDDAASWRFRRRPRVLWARRPPRPWIDVPGPAFTVEPVHVTEAIAHDRRTPSARAELATETGRRRVAGPPRAVT